jgi:hypothetical protein
MAWWDETCDWREQVGLPKAALRVSGVGTLESKPWFAALAPASSTLRALLAQAIPSILMGRY